jgi:hypothetical protein
MARSHAQQGELEEAKRYFGQAQYDYKALCAAARNTHNSEYNSDCLDASMDEQERKERLDDYRYELAKTYRIIGEYSSEAFNKAFKGKQ